MLVFGPPRAGGHAERAGIQQGDRLDIREQPVATRLANISGLPGAKSTTLIVRRGARVITIPLVGSTVWDGASNVKLLYTCLPVVNGLFLLGCALLIVVRRATHREARTLALILLCLVPSATQFLGIFPFADPFLYVAFATPLASLALLVALSSGFGVRSLFRTCADWIAYATIGVFAVLNALYWYGLVTLRFDPLPLGYGLPILVAGYVLFVPRSWR